MYAEWSFFLNAVVPPTVYTQPHKLTPANLQSREGLLLKTMRNTGKLVSYYYSDATIHDEILLMLKENEYLSI